MFLRWSMVIMQLFLKYVGLSRIVLFLWALLSPAILVYSKTDPSSVSALNVMYSSLNSPSQLGGWKSSGGDPCGESWDGIKCSGSSVTEIDLSGLGLSGSLGYQLSSLTSVSTFDLSDNNLNGDIPYQLPPNAKHIDLSKNDFSGGVPYSITQMTDLKYLNLGNNQLNGQLSDVYGKLAKLSKLDLSYNLLSGNLPRTFASLSSLDTLYLQNNKFTGPIDVLADLPLNDLDVSNNQFSGWIPDELKEIKNIETGGNSWSSGPAPPPPPGSHKNPRTSTEDNKPSLSIAVIVGTIVGVLLLLIIVISLISRKSSSPVIHYLDEEGLGAERSFTPLVSQELSKDARAGIAKGLKDLKSFDSSSSISVKSMQKSPSNGLKLLPTDGLKSFNENEFAYRQNVKRSSSIHSTSYTLADLQTATGNFATSQLLGQGSIGHVYKAKFANGKVSAIKKIDSSLFKGGRVNEYLETLSIVTKLHHPNITELVGYCSEHGENMLIHHYYRNGSLYEFLHLSDDYGKPLTWNTRVKIALGTAQAIEYLHGDCSTSIVHRSIKSSNILLDVELNPHLADCGLESFYQRTNRKSEMGYNAPECSSPSAYTFKSDVYSFGVVMLELLTGRMPFDSSKSRSEESLVQWATPQLHDIGALEKMVDPALRGLYPPQSISLFADIIGLCVQMEPEFRPPVSEVVQALVRLTQRLF